MKFMSDTHLTSLKLPVTLFTEFKVTSVRNKMNLQKLTERSMFLYVTDDIFRNLINNTFHTELSGSL